MKFKLSRQTLSKELIAIISREIRRQKISVPRVTRKEMQELAEISQLIETKGLPSNLVRKKLSKKLGYGIFLHPDAAPLEKGCVIASYSGKVSLIRQRVFDDGSYAFTPIEDILLKANEQRLFDKTSCFRPKRLYSLKVDALKQGNFTRFINHSAQPNVVAYTLAVPANPYGLVPGPIEVVYFAKKRIMPGEQLLVSYEEGEKCYWGAKGIKPLPMTPKTFRLTKKGILSSR